MDASPARSSAFHTADVHDLDQWFRIADRDYLCLLEAVDFPALFADFEGPVRLLDAGCGSGKFPSLMAPSLDPNCPITVDYLDPAERYLAQYAADLPAPFVAGQPLPITLQNLPSNGPAYQVAWAIHSLGSVPEGQLQGALSHLVKAVGAGGAGLIFQQSRDSFYARAFGLYCEHTRQGSPLICAEQVVAALEALGVSFELEKLDYTHQFDANDEALLQNYLRMCLMSTDPLETMRSCAPLDALLRSYRDGDRYQISQSAWLLRC